jgi:HEXXH motif-containing protein
MSMAVECTASESKQRALDLTLPNEGSTLLREWVSRSLGQSMRYVFQLSSLRGSMLFRQAARQFQTHILPIFKKQPGFLAASLRAPSRLVLARCLAMNSDASMAIQETWALQLMTFLTLDAACAGWLENRTVELPAVPGWLVSEQQSYAFRVEGVRKWSWTGTVIHAHTPKVTLNWDLTLPVDRWPNAGQTNSLLSTMIPYEPLFGKAVLACLDTNPLANLEAHPDKSGNKTNLGEKSVEHWVQVLRDAYQIIEQLLPELAEEMSWMLRHVVPVGYDDEKHLSASYLEASGVVYLTLHPHLMTMVEALIHEFQHNKLNVVLGIDPVLHNAEFPLFASPVRPDPRPLRGVLLAVHAFQPIAKMYEAMLELPNPPVPVVWIRNRLHQVAIKCREGCSVLLPNAQPTEFGHAILAEIAQIDEELAPYLTPPEPAAPIETEIVPTSGENGGLEGNSV